MRKFKVRYPYGSNKFNKQMKEVIIEIDVPKKVEKVDLLKVVMNFCAYNLANFDKSRIKDFRILKEYLKSNYKITKNNEK